MSQSNGGDRTEKATPKKRKDARDKGQIFKSVDLTTAFSLLVLFFILSIAGTMMTDGMKNLAVRYFSIGQPEAFTVGNIHAVFKDVYIRLAVILLPVLAAALVAGIVFNFLQVGALFTAKAIQPKFSRISMVEGFKRIFSKKTLIDLLKSLVRLAVVAKVAYDEYTLRIQGTPTLMYQDLDFSISATWDMVLGIAFKLAIALAVLGPVDYFLQWRQYERDLMMTKQEIKDEYKMTEGNPQIKGRIRQKQRQMSSMRMMQAVADADVVITNPTHFAVALSYKEGVNGAPVVVAKGQDFLAKRIREKAKEHRVEIVENKSLARSLYFHCEIGDEVPEELYQAVAEILAYVYRLKHPETRK
ncbi:MAG TPA: flagellar biosynthesis protein FlhB [Feifaniaceae bacterium]|nr:flagellar biosynthesis protein FlhB [Feifaniaceae bacterium]